MVELNASGETPTAFSNENRISVSAGAVGCFCWFIYLIFLLLGFVCGFGFFFFFVFGIKVSCPHPFSRGGSILLRDVINSLSAFVCLVLPCPLTGHGH